MMGRPSASKFPTLSDHRTTLNTVLPLGIGYVGAMLIGITDNVMLGHLSTDALSAAGLAFSIYNIILMAGWGILFPVMVFVARLCGTERSRPRLALKVIRQGLWVCGILFVPAGVILWNTTNILMLAGQDPTLARMAGQYMDYYLWAVFPIFGRYVFIMALTALGRTGTVALIIWSEVGLNIILNYGLIFGKFGLPAMGMAGAGLASIIVYGIGHTTFFFSVFRFNRFFKDLVVRRVWNPNRDILEELFRLGWPKKLELLTINHYGLKVHSLGCD